MLRIPALCKVARKFRTKIFFKYSNINGHQRTTLGKEKDKWSEIQNIIKHSQQKQSIQLCELFLKQQTNKQQHWNAHYELATIYSKLNEYKKAITHFSECIRLNRSNSRSYMGLADCLKQYGDSFQAISVLQNGIQNCLDKFEICIKLGEIYCQMEDYIKVFELYSVQIAKNKEIIKTVFKQGQARQDINYLIFKLAVDPNQQNIAIKLKDSFLNKDKVTEGVQFFKFILQKQHNFANLYTLGTLLFQNGLCLQAKPYLQQAHHLDKQNYFVNLFLGTIAQQEGKASEAISFLQKASLINSTSSEPLSFIGFILMQNSKNKQAISKFKHALQINPNDVLTLSCLGTLLISTNINQGINLLQKALELDPNNEFTISKLKSTLIMLGRQEEWSKIQQKIKNSQLK